jgi:hypothetical protein
LRYHITIKQKASLECSLSDREYTDLARWRRQRGRKHARRVEKANAELRKEAKGLK